MNLSDILPELPEGYRWKLVKDFEGDPKLKLQQKSPFGWWHTVDRSYVSANMGNSIEYALKFSARMIMDRRRGKIEAEKYYGTSS